MTPEQQAYAHEVADWAVPGRLGYDQNEWIYVLGNRDRDSDTNEPIGIPVEKMREGSCRTSACIAGRIAIDRAPAGTMVFDGEKLKFPDQTEMHISEFAAGELGLTIGQADQVFYASAPRAAERLHYMADHPDAEPYEICEAAW